MRCFGVITTYCPAHFSEHSQEQEDRRLGTHLLPLGRGESIAAQESQYTLGVGIVGIYLALQHLRHIIIRSVVNKRRSPVQKVDTPLLIYHDILQSEIAVIQSPTERKRFEFFK